MQWLVSGVENLSLEGKGWAGAGHWHYRTRLQRADGAEAAAGGQTGPKAKRYASWLRLSSNFVPTVSLETDDLVFK